MLWCYVVRFILYRLELVDWFVSANTNVIKLQSHSTIDKKINNEKEFRRIVEALSSNIHDTNTNTNTNTKTKLEMTKKNEAKKTEKKNHTTLELHPSQMECAALQT